MSWQALGWVVVLMAPIAGLLVVALLAVLQQDDGQGSLLPPVAGPRPIRRANAGPLDDLLKSRHVRALAGSSREWRARRLRQTRAVVVPAASWRAGTSLLDEYLVERLASPAVRPRAPRPAAGPAPESVARAPRPTRLVPLSV